MTSIQVLRLATCEELEEVMDKDKARRLYSHLHDTHSGQAVDFDEDSQACGEGGVQEQLRQAEEEDRRTSMRRQEEEQWSRIVEEFRNITEERDKRKKVQTDEERSRVAVNVSEEQDIRERMQADEEQKRAIVVECDETLQSAVRVVASQRQQGKGERC